MRIPEHPSLLRKILLSPATLGYAAGSALHRALWLRPRPDDAARRPPLIVIGGARAGGAGKTPVAIALARHLRARGLRVGILAYWIHRAEARPWAEIHADSDWRASSDEAVLLARASGGARVFVTRDRERLWAALARTAAFDVLIADDGLMDPRLHRAFRVALGRLDDRPRWTDLIPSGPWRLTASALGRVDYRLQEGRGFTRRLVLAEGMPAEKLHWIVCGLGNPEHFLRSLRDAGTRIAGVSRGPDHGLPDLKAVRRAAGRRGVDRFLCSEKDWVKLERHSERPAHLLPVAETVTLSPEFLEAVDRLLDGPWDGTSVPATS